MPDHAWSELRPTPADLPANSPAKSPPSPSKRAAMAVPAASSENSPLYNVNDPILEANIIMAMASSLLDSCRIEILRRNPINRSPSFVHGHYTAPIIFELTHHLQITNSPISVTYSPRHHHHPLRLEAPQPTITITVAPLASSASTVVVFHLRLGKQPTFAQSPNSLSSIPRFSIYFALQHLSYPLGITLLFVSVAVAYNPQARSIFRIGNTKLSQDTRTGPHHFGKFDQLRPSPSNPRKTQLKGEDRRSSRPDLVPGDALYRP